MSFQWNPRFSSEWPKVPEPPVWFFLLVFVVVECAALATVDPWHSKGPIGVENVVRYLVVVPFLCWLAFSCLLYKFGYDIPATQAAVHNAERWHEITSWQHASRRGVAVLDSVILTPEPDLAQRMLGLEGTAPENPGRVMVLGDIGTSDGLRLHALLVALLTPLAARLTPAVNEDPLFDIVVQCDDEEAGREVEAVWSKLELPGQPVVRWMDNSRDAGLADRWFEDQAPRYWYEREREPRYRLLLAWHLHREDQEVTPARPESESEAAVALLLGSPELMYEKPELKRQAWLVRQTTGEADQADRLLGLLLKTEQVQVGTIRHFWYSRLKGLAQHATVGAVRESALKVEQHALDPAIGPQAPVARWLLQALAAKMAQFGQGAQLVALPHEQGVSFNVVAKERAPVDVPWKEQYDYDTMLIPELVGLLSAWGACMLGFPKGWNDGDTFITCVCAGTFIGLFLYRIRAKLPSVLEGIGSVILDIIWETFFFWKR